MHPFTLPSPTVPYLTSSDRIDRQAPRALAIAQPLKVTITNWPTDTVETFTAERHPKRPEMGSRDIPFSGHVYIDKDDFFDTGVDGSIPVPKGYKRLVPGGQVRLKYAYVITCDTVVRDATGQAVELVCSYDPRTRAGATPEGAKKAKGIVQWVSQAHAVPAELALFDRLFTAPSPGRDHEDGDFLRDLNPQSLTVLPGACVEPSLVGARPGDRFQFERLGYFCVDIGEPRAGSAGGGAAGRPLVFNRVVTLKDTWAAGATDDAPAAAAAAAAASSSSSKPAAPAAAGGDGAAAVASEDVLRIELRVGQILSAELHPDAETLYVEKIDVGEKEPRTVISGLAKFMPPEALVGRRVVVVCNLKPSKMRGIMSEGMVLAASTGSPDDGTETVELLTAPEGAAVGELVQVEGLPPPTPDVQLKSKTAQDAWKRVAAALCTDADGHATYTGATHADGGATKPRRLLTSAGPCAVPTLKVAPIR
jgi:methionine--tRNA ligase beta chain